MELPRVRPSLPHLCVSPPGLDTQKMSVEWVFAACRSKALGFGRQFLEVSAGTRLQAASGLGGPGHSTDVEFQ